MTRRLPLAEGALAAYFAVAVAVGLLPAVGVTQQSLVGAMSFSPADLMSGKLWLLPLSGVIVDGETWSQLAMLIGVAAALIALAGARTFWRAAILAHVGSTVVAYAVLGVLAVTAPSTIGDLFQDPDYGVSCVWAGSVGALAVVAARRCSSRRAKVVVAAGVSAPLVVVLTTGFLTPSGKVDLATLEHFLAFVIGMLAVAARRDHRARRALTALARAPRAGARTIPRRTTRSPRRRAGASSTVLRTSRSTTRISISAKLAPRQRRIPPPNGSHV
jgi:hypothetical protein